MSYIGSTPTSQAFAPGTDTFSGTGSQTAFTLSRNVATVNDILVIVNNVEQQPSNYSVSVSTLTFSTAPSSGTNNIYVRYLSTNLITIAPQQGSVTQKAMDVGSGGVGTGAAQMPVGTTAQRPATPLVGMFRLNTTTGNPEWYDTVSSTWVNFSNLPNYPVEILIVAGGGGGGNYNSGGGGGAGGLLYYGSETPKTPNGSAITIISGTALSVVIGAGGTGAQNSSSPQAQNGTNSSVSGTGFTTLTAIGGGFGSMNTINSVGSGGSGGGGGNTMLTGGSGTVGQGNNGGSTTSNAPNYGGGGGGGAGAVGGTGSSTVSGAGGVGLAYSISGSSVFYAGGGGGSTQSGGTGGAGGNGGGGTGATSSNSYVATAGTANRGGGGGAGGYGSSTTNGASGGSGIVILRYAGDQRGSGGTVTSAGGYTIHTFTTSGTFTA
jgi:hypothetical protein